MTNFGMYFYGESHIDAVEQTAQTLYDILAAPGYFQLMLGISDDDLEDENTAKHKLENWLKAEYYEF